MSMTTAPGHRIAPESVSAGCHAHGFAWAWLAGSMPTQSHGHGTQPKSINAPSPSARLGSYSDHQLVEHLKCLVRVGSHLGHTTTTAQEHRPALHRLLEDRPRRSQPAVLVDSAPDLRLGQLAILRTEPGHHRLNLRC